VALSAALDASARGGHGTYDTTFSAIFSVDF
jgi:hypothetical protein